MGRHEGFGSRSLAHPYRRAVWGPTELHRPKTSVPGRFALSALCYAQRYVVEPTKD
jgi:hypothetical protein